MAHKMPYHLETEKSVLACIFADPNSILIVADILNVADFYEKSHQNIYEVMLELNSDKMAIDTATVASRLQQKDKIQESGGIDYLADIQNHLPSVSHIESYVEIIKNDSIVRQIIMTSDEISQTGLTVDISAKDLLEKLEEKTLTLSKLRRVGEFTKIDTLLPEIRKNIELAATTDREVTGLYTGFTKLDQATSGLQPQELVIIAARPGMGKSALVMNLATNVASLNKERQASVAIFSLEMSNEQLIQRMLASYSGINSHRIRNGNLTAKDWSELNFAEDRLSRLNLHFDDSATSNITDIRAKCRSLSIKNKLDLIVIDYLQLVTDGGGARQEEVSRISRKLKQMAREFNVPVIALSQLNRQVDTRDKESKKPVLSDLRESGSIEQDADIVLFIYRDDYYQRDERSEESIAELMIAKNRHGSTNSIYLTFRPAVSTFTQYDGSIETTDID